MRTKTSTAGNNGFTLLELIIVMVIAGLASAVVIFSIGRIRDSTVFNQEARRIYQTLKRAREIAVIERTDVTVKIDEEAGRYGIERSDGKTLVSRTLPRGTGITGKDIVFFPKGDSSGGVIKLQNEKGQGYAIEVSQVLGRPEIRRL
ncbi:MAG: prepilin-type N-terminal cleavage/methylation domain-containing protein [Nitrospiraceae bacterium]|nr:prepilin-type N-terminal cleavage/methylation domain-containing protein [Nitrospiraceae bacterium]